MIPAVPITRLEGEGASLRVEDAALVQGRGRFVDDLAPAGLLHLAVARAVSAPATIRSIAVDEAMAVPGVVAVLTGADVRDLGRAAVNRMVPGQRPRPFEPLAVERVEAVGQPIAAVVARSLAAAREAAELIAAELEEGDFEPERLFESGFEAGDAARRFAEAAHVARVVSRHPRLAPSPMEPRAALAVPEADGEPLTLWLSTQTPHRARTDLAAILCLDETQVRVVAPDVGGAFGGKASIYPEDALVAFAALRLQRPVKWCAARAEDLLAATHGRGQSLTGEMAFAADGRITALKATIAAPLGHWTPFSSAVPARNAARILPGPYAVDDIQVDYHGETTPTAAVGIYRGAGRPEAAMLLERLVEAGARGLGLDPLDLRLKNLIRPEAMPWKTATGEIIDSGRFAELIAAARQASGYDGARKALAGRRRRGAICGIGAALYIEPCGQGFESARVALGADGRFLVATGSSAQGQGRVSAYRRIAAAALGTEAERIEVVHGDTARTPAGIGALASRSTAIGGSAVKVAAERLLAAAKLRAAPLLGCAPEAVAAYGEGLREARRGGVRLSWAALAAHAAAEGAPLAIELRYEPKGEAWSSGCVIASVAIDPDTFELGIEKLTWVDDAGHVVDEGLVRDQLLGGMAQGVGEALMERIVYDGHNQLVTGSLMDYALPRAADVPPVTLLSLHTPSPFNALGAKGVGEAGCIGIPAAILNAALDALAPLGVTALDPPLTGAAIFAAVGAASSQAQGDTP